MAWLLAQQRGSCPSPAQPKSTGPKGNLAADDVTLNEAELAQLDDLSSRVEIHGGRYPIS
jgi:aryl-alcohol dehydrogenase-like predicted oxidoreductase